MTKRSQTRRKPTIVAIGDINVDMLGRVKSWPKPGQDCLAPQLEMHCGGVGANSALALARWGIDVRLAGCVGRDRFGDYVLEHLAEGGVNTRWAQRTSDAMTGFFYINITPDGERTFFGSRAANGHVKNLRNVQALCQGAAAAHLVGYNFLNPGPARAAKQIAREIHARGGWVSLDVGMAPAQQIPGKILQIIPTVDILLLSTDEATLLTGARDPRRAFAALKKAGAREVVLKLGKSGCLISRNGELQHVPSFDVKMVDSTGAGDAFVAGFLQACLRGWSPEEAAIAATAGGAAAVSFVGAGETLPGSREVSALMRSQRLRGKWDAVRQSALARLQNRNSRPEEAHMTPLPDHNQLPEWKKELDRPRMKSLADLFPVPKPVIGMVHLWPLPGAPGYTGYGMQKIIDHALRDAEALVQGGVDGLAVENMWDLPYYVGNDVKPEAMTAHAVAAAEIVKNFPIPVGINVIHNGGTVCLSIALAAGARWIRVCILTGARVWDTGEFDHGCAAELMRKRKELHAEGIHIFADVDKKHSVPFPGIDLRTHIEWTEFYGADALIVSGRFTGSAPDVEKVREAKTYAKRPILIGSGTSADNVAAFLEHADGIIVGTSLKKDGVMQNEVDTGRVHALMNNVQPVRERAAARASSSHS